MNPTQIVEAVLFASDAPLRAEEIARADEALDEWMRERHIGHRLDLRAGCQPSLARCRCPNRIAPAGR